MVRVLIVDDHRLFTEALTMLLDGAEGIEVVGVARTGAEAVRLTIDQTPDVVLMDQGLPDGDGLDAARTIKQATPEAKVIVLTQFADDLLLAAAMEAGCAGFVTKDRPSSELVQAIRAVAVGEAAIPPAMLGRVLPRLHRSTVGHRIDLTPREREILHLLAHGVETEAIADNLSLSLSTVRNHIQGIFTKLGVHSKLEAVTTAVRAGLVHID